MTMKPAPTAKRRGSRRAVSAAPVNSTRSSRANEPKDGEQATWLLEKAKCASAKAAGMTRAARNERLSASSAGSLARYQRAGATQVRDVVPAIRGGHLRHSADVHTSRAGRIRQAPRRRAKAGVS